MQANRFPLLAVALAGAWLLASAVAEPPAGVVFDFIGKSAVNVLGKQKLTRVLQKSRMNHKTVEELSKQIEDDPDLGVDVDNEMLIYACGGLVAEAPPGAEAAANVITEAGAAPVAAENGHHHHHHHHHRHLMQTGSGLELATPWWPDMPDTPISQAQAFSLHSRPNAALKIFLDFDGHVTTNSAWNSASYPQIVTPAYDTDGNTASFSASELANILSIWCAVSEDYAPFNVDVTTEDPGAAYLATSGTRVAIGGSSTDWYGSAGGVAYVNVFARYNNYYQPAFVFPAQLGNGYHKYVAEAISHEVGHNVGLSHDGVTGGDAYYAGQGDWAPIMGVGYNKPITQFSRGEYANANNLEDDFTIISGYLGPVSNVPENHGGDLATATPVGGVMNADGLTASAKVLGVIRSPQDTQVMYFDAAAAGTATLRVLVAPNKDTSVVRANLNLQLTVTASDGTTTLYTTSGVGIGPMSVNLAAAGRYYITLNPVGSGDPATTGYSTYGSRGQYELLVTYPVDGTVSSPPPSPSPSPPPAPTVMTTTWMGQKQQKGKKWQCNFSIKVTNTANDVALDNAAVTGSWAIGSTAYSATTLSTGTTGTGSVTFNSVTFSSTAGLQCKLTISSVTRVDSVLDSAAKITDYMTF